MILILVIFGIGVLPLPPLTKVAVQVVAVVFLAYVFLEGLTRW